MNYEKHVHGDLYYIQDVDLRTVAFTWDPKPMTKAVGLMELDQIITKHTYGFHGFFKPSIAEVLSQIPNEYLNDAVAFETHYKGMSGSYHSGLTTLYRRVSVSELDNEINLLQKMKNNLESLLR